MNDIKSQVFDRLRKSHHRRDAQSIRAIIAAADVEPLPGTPRLVSASEIADIWTTRLANTSITGAQIDGARAFLPRLRRLAPGACLEQFSFKGPHSGGNLFFEPETGDFIGFVFNQGSALAAARTA